MRFRRLCSFRNPYAIRWISSRFAHFIEVFKIYKLLNLLKLEKLFFVGSPIVTTLGGSWAVITAVYMVLFGLNFGQNRPFFALQKSNFGFAFENERTVRKRLP